MTTTTDRDRRIRFLDEDYAAVRDGIRSVTASWSARSYTSPSLPLPTVDELVAVGLKAIGCDRRDMTSAELDWTTTEAEHARIAARS